MTLLLILLIVLLVLFLTQRRPALGYHAWSRRPLFGREYAPIEGYCGCDSSGTQCSNNNNNVNNGNNGNNGNNVEGFTPKRGGCGCQSSIPSPFL